MAGLKRAVQIRQQKAKTLLANVCQNAKCFTAAGQGVHGSLEIAEWFDKQNQTGWQELLQQKQGCDVITLAHFLPHQVFLLCPVVLVTKIKLVNTRILTVCGMGLNHATCAEHMDYCLCVLESSSCDVKCAIRQMQSQKA